MTSTGAARDAITGTGPVFVVGLPRSGSTLLSRLLNDTPDILSVNDLYYLQGVIAEDALDGALTVATAEQLADRLLEVIGTRSEADDGFIGQFRLDPPRIRRIREHVLDAHAAAPMTWDVLMDALLTAVARAAGKSRWADKTPQNFQHFRLLSERFADARFVFLFRDPGPILASYKHARGEGHDLRRYHPLVYALYWRSAARCYLQVADHPRVALVRYEDLLADPAAVCRDLGEFLGTCIVPGDLASLGGNSSFSGGRRREITAAEAWICERLCGDEMAHLGYPRVHRAPRLRDLPELVWISVRCAAFHARRILADRDARNRALTFIRGL